MILELLRAKEAVRTRFDWVEISTSWPESNQSEVIHRGKLYVEQYMQESTCLLLPYHLLQVSLCSSTTAL